MKTISFIGSGRITKIFLQAFQNAHIKFDKIVVFDMNESALANLKNKYPQVSFTENIDEVRKIRNFQTYRLLFGN